jgi:hypothetical protein
VLGPGAPPAVVPAASATVLTLPELVLRPNNQCSTSELATPGTDARAAALDETQKGLARCSLERR